MTVLGGTVISQGATTIHETKVIGTYIQGKYAQILESTSKIIQPTPKLREVAPSPTYVAPGQTASALPNLQVSELFSRLHVLSRTVTSDPRSIPGADVTLPRVFPKLEFQILEKKSSNMFLGLLHEASGRVCYDVKM